MRVRIHVICGACGFHDAEVLDAGDLVSVPLFNCVCGRDQSFTITHIEPAGVNATNRVCPDCGADDDHLHPEPSEEGRCRDCCSMCGGFEFKDVTCDTCGGVLNDPGKAIVLSDGRGLRHRDCPDPDVCCGTCGQDRESYSDA